MLTNEEWEHVWSAKRTAQNAGRDWRPAALAEYERITGYKEINYNAIFHHLIVLHGPPCPRCGKTLRTNVAYKCFECGMQVHEPNWSFVSKVSAEGFALGRRGVVVPVNLELAAARLGVGDVIQVRTGTRIVLRGAILEFGAYRRRLLWPRRRGILIDAQMPRIRIRTTAPRSHFRVAKRLRRIAAGFEVWLVHSPTWPSATAT